ncbi:MAG: hypothetical protein AAF430_22465 [Myxococcota bacterium]
MRWRSTLLCGLLATTLGTSACLMPTRGTPVFVDSFAGDYWSGEGLLVEVSPDQKQCRVALRDSALIVREEWVACTSVHPRRGR